MPLAFNAQSTLDFTSSNSWSHSGASSGVVAAVVFIAQTAVSTDLISGVTYGGVSMTRVPTDGLAQDAAGEPGAAYAYTLLTSVPQGTQTVAATVSSGTDAKTGWAMTFTGGASCRIAASGRVQGDVANPSVTLGTAANFVGFAMSVLYSGLAAPADATIAGGSGYTKLTGSASGGRDFGNQAATAEYGAKSGANVACGWTASSDDVAMCALAIEEIRVPEVLFGWGAE